jgi:hypothetical protein
MPTTLVPLAPIGNRAIIQRRDIGKFYRINILARGKP